MDGRVDGIVLAIVLVALLMIVLDIHAAIVRPPTGMRTWPTLCRIYFPTLMNKPEIDEKYGLSIDYLPDLMMQGA
nr:hypothetical protein [uncultured Massilia sp.]